MNDTPQQTPRGEGDPAPALEQAGTHPLGTAAGAARGSGGTTAKPVAGPGVRAEESVAGEEDPGASIDLAVPPGGAPKTNPGDEAPAGTPGAGEAVCARCGGTGRLGDTPCPACGGTGKVVQGIGGA
jgi:hypothetical protein